jgi:hypothetical protein
MNARRLGSSIATLLWTMQAFAHAHLFGTNMPTVFYCGDDREAKSHAAELIRDAGLQPIDDPPWNHPVGPRFLLPGNPSMVLASWQTRRYRWPSLADELIRQFGV